DRQLVPTLPLFRNSGSLDAAAGSLTGLVAGSLPSGGSGEVLGDTNRERFATLDFRVGEGATAGLNLALNPTKLPTRANQPLAAGQIVAVGTNTPTLPVLVGLADQPQVGVHRYQIQSFDGAGRSWQRMLSLTITNVNDAPVAVPLGPITAVEDQPFAFNVGTAFSDQDIAVGDVLTYRLLGQSPSWLGLNATTGLLQGAPGNAEVGPWQLSVEARDLKGATARQTLDLVVANVNDAPIWNAEPLPEIWVREGNPFEIRLPAGTITDIDQGDRLTYSLDLAQAPGLVSMLAIDQATGVITGLATADQSELFTFGLVATDQSGASIKVPLQLRVVDRDFNRAPYRVGPDLFDRSIQEGQSVAFDLPRLFRDDDFLIGDRLNYQVDLPDWLRFDPTTGQVSGLADNNAVGSYRINLRAVDNFGATALASFGLTVDNVNQAPDRLVPPTEQRSLLLNAPFSLNLNRVFRDLDAIHGDQLSFSLKARSSSTLGMPNALRFDPRTGEVSFTPGASDRGQLSLLFGATDRSGASSSYQLDLGIVSPDGWVEVNRSLPDLVLREGTPSLLDLSTAFQQMRGSATLAYTVEALRLGKDGQLTSVQDPSWLSLFDRRQEGNSTDRITITPTLRRLDTGELIRPEDLAGLPVGSALGMEIKVNDLRRASSMPGVIGLDLDLNWSGLELVNPASAKLQEAITSLFPLYRQVDSSELADNHLRFSAASLPNLGLGEALGDSPEESFLRLDFRLSDPTKPVRLDLTLNGEDKGGLGIGLADGSNPGTNLNLKPFSSSALIDLLLRPGAEQVGNLVLRITAKATDQGSALDSGHQDSVSQMLRVRVENTRNNAPTVASLMGSTKLKDNRVQVIELRDLFRDSDDYADDTPPLSYSLKVKG
ncbi:MAG: putative Ig domain-containing protein, partial [Cyanobium sp. LacPavin_0920_WC12_MAG_62_9]|nr:putative Ig domain-containing protein [Cyanobium sp. LacPavin_0920_WC12_MAG_62_9]